MSLKIKSFLKCLASELRINLRNPLNTKLATDSPGWIHEEITMTFLFLIGYFLLGLAVIEINGTGNPNIESHKTKRS